MPVVNKKGKMVGVISEFDILSQVAAAKTLDPKAFAKAAKFSRDLDTVLDCTSLDEVISRFIESRYRRLPVTDKSGRLLGIITRRDLMRVFYYRAKLKP